MKHYGPEPPWRGDGNYGRWLWIKPDPNAWFEEPGFWEWRPRRSISQIIGDFYVKPMNDFLSQESIFFEVLKGSPLPKSAAAKAAE